jgi:hypothetical protein
MAAVDLRRDRRRDAAVSSITSAGILDRTRLFDRAGLRLAAG